MFTNPKYLRGEQYRNAGNLQARIALHSRFSTNSYGWFRWVFDHLDLPPVSRLLELGSGPADLWVENSLKLPEKWEVNLSDLSSGMLRQACAEPARLPGRLSLCCSGRPGDPFSRRVF